MSETKTQQVIGEFTVTKQVYDWSKFATYYVKLTGSDETITVKTCKTDRAVLKLVDKAREIVARKAAQKAATAARHAAKDAAKGVVRDECQICSGAWVIENGHTSLHGYTRPGHGWLVGSCMGARELPFSKSCAVLKMYGERVAAYKVQVQDSIDELKSGRVVEITRIEKRRERGQYMSQAKIVTVVYKKGAAFPVDSDHARDDFADLVKVEIAKAESEMKHVVAEIKRVAERVTLWQSKYGK